ncbi:MAG: hypothetical protein ACI8UO_003904 [Verrucomicrobiales bacterium]|jgi:hypothetical protein
MEWKLEVGRISGEIYIPTERSLDDILVRVQFEVDDKTYDRLYLTHGGAPPMDDGSYRKETNLPRATNVDDVKITFEKVYVRD